MRQQDPRLTKKKKGGEKKAFHYPPRQIQWGRKKIKRKGNRVFSPLKKEKKRGKNWSYPFCNLIPGR